MRKSFFFKIETLKVLYIFAIIYDFRGCHNKSFVNIFSLYKIATMDGMGVQFSTTVSNIICSLRIDNKVTECTF